MMVLKSVASAAFLGALLFAAPMVHADKMMDAGHKGRHWDRFELMKKRLDLTDGQVQRLRDGEKGQMKEAKLLRDKLKADEADLKVLVDEQASVGALKAGLRALEQDHQDMQKHAQERMDLYKRVLTPMQQAKLVVMMLGRRGHRGFAACGPRGGWGGHHPGGHKAGKAGWSHGDSAGGS